MGGNKNKRNNHNSSNNSKKTGKSTTTTSTSTSQSTTTTTTDVNNSGNASGSGSGSGINNASGSGANSNSKRKLLTYKQREELNGLVMNLLNIGYQTTVNVKEEWNQYISMQTILKRVLELEAPFERFNKGIQSNNTTSLSIDDRLAKIDAFTKWANENDVKVNGVEIAVFPGYQLGLKATRDIAKQEEIITVPRKLIFSEEHMSRGNVKCNFGPMTNVSLAYALILERVKPHSFWKPYTDLLPSEYNTVLYFSTEQMNALRGTSAFSDGLRQCRVIARQYAYLYKCAHLTPEMGHFTSMEQNFKDHFCYDLYRWSVSTVMSRDNFIPREVPLATTAYSQQVQPHMLAALIPYWDMANHKSGTITSFYNAETNELQCAAQEPCKAGEQFFIFYGIRSNADLLVHNGFIDPDNRKDVVTIKLGLSKSDPLCEQRAALLNQLDIQRSADFDVLPAPDYISGKLLAFVRVFNMTAEQLAHWTENAAERAMDLLHIDCALETNHESKTWQYLETRLMLLLRVYPTTLEEDEEELKKHHNGTKVLGYVDSIILEYRVLEKRILAAALENVKERCKA